MRSSIQVVLVYVLVSLALACGSDWIASERYQTIFPSACLCKETVFVIATSLLLFILLSREALRRNSVEQGLRKLAIYDPLTGLLNRACIIKNLEDAIARAARDGIKVGVVFIDLDGFKEVNDAFGHHVGDEFLICVANRIKNVVRATDSASRFGGDEFVVLVHGQPDGGTKRMAERLAEALREPILVKGMTINASASIGYALYPDHGRQIGQLLRAADMAMYRVKQSGKDSFLGALPESQEEHSPPGAAEHLRQT
jgi:diguanylate cyclase (GGDEF)-like protein